MQVVGAIGAAADRSFKRNRVLLRLRRFEPLFGIHSCMMLSPQCMHVSTQTRRLSSRFGSMEHVIKHTDISRLRQVPTAHSLHRPAAFRE